MKLTREVSVSPLAAIQIALIIVGHFNFYSQAKKYPQSTPGSIAILQLSRWTVLSYVKRPFKDFTKQF